MSIRTRWQKSLNLPDYLEHVQQSSLKVTLSTQMHKEAWGVIRNTLEEVLVWGLPQLTKLATARVHQIIFPNHLQKLRFHGFAMSDSWPSMTLPSPASLEIVADSPDHLLVMRYIQVPQLWVLRVQVEGGPRTLHKHDWRNTTNNLLDQISLGIEKSHVKQGTRTLFFICLRPILSTFFRHIYHCTYISPNQRHYSILSMPVLEPCQAHCVTRLEHSQQWGMRN